MALPFDPQGSTAALNAAGFQDTPAGRAAYPGTTYPTSTGATGGAPVADTTTQLVTGIQNLLSAMASGNSQAAQEAIREYNLNYADTQAGTYGQNFGLGQVAPTTASTLASGQATGGVGYIPGFTGINAGQTQSELSTQAATAQAAAGLTGFYAAPSQSQYTPGTFVRLDPSTYPQQYGTQISYVLPSGQLQRVSTTQAQAMGWNGNLGTMPTISAQQAIGLESAPPSQLPQQTLAGLTGYSNLNSAAITNALNASAQTGMYQAPAQVLPPGTNAGGGKFSDLPPATQQAYYQSRGGDWNAAMTAWVNDSNAALQQATQAAGGTWNPNQPGTPQETLAAQGQYFTQANDLATQYGQYYAPGAPGQAGVAGVNTPQAGQTTLAGQQQAYAQQMGVINAAAALQANPFRQAQVIGQAGRVLQGLPTAGFSAPNTVTGVGTAGGNTQGGMGYMSQLIQDIQDPTANQTTAQSWLDNTPTPNKLDSVSFLNSSPTTQNLILQSMQEKYGIDPTDATAQIKATMPQFNAPNTLGTVRRG